MLAQNRPHVKLEVLKVKLLRDEVIGWIDIPLNTVPYGSEYSQGSEKWYHMSTLKRTGYQF